MSNRSRVLTTISGPLQWSGGWYSIQIIPGLIPTVTTNLEIIIQNLSG